MAPVSVVLILERLCPGTNGMLASAWRKHSISLTAPCVSDLELPWRSGNMASCLCANCWICCTKPNCRPRSWLLTRLHGRKKGRVKCTTHIIWSQRESPVYRAQPCRSKPNSVLSFRRSVANHHHHRPLWQKSKRPKATCGFIIPQSGITWPAPCLHGLASCRAPGLQLVLPVGEGFGPYGSQNFGVAQHSLNSTNEMNEEVMICVSPNPSPVSLVVKPSVYI